MSETKHNRLQALIGEIASEFLSRESNRTSIITITSVELSRDEKYATILFTAFPDGKEEEALDFLKRNRSDFREFFMEKSRVQRVPFFDFRIDAGEKNRQRVEELI